MDSNFIDSAKVMAKGQLTIPKAVREVMGISPGDRVSFLVKEGSVQVINSKEYLLLYEEQVKSRKAEEAQQGDEDESKIHS